MRKMSILIVLFLAAVIAFACGGEKEEETHTMEKPPMQIQQGTPAEGFAWESLPPFPGAISTKARMAPGNREYARFEIRMFQSRDSARNIVNFYKENLPEADWAFSQETKLDNGLQGVWESKTEPTTLWVRVMKSKTEEGNEIEMIYGKKK